jgi:hypothetical protein
VCKGRTHGVVKKSQKIDRKEIDKAGDARNAYINAIREADIGNIGPLIDFALNLKREGTNESKILNLYSPN